MMRSAALLLLLGTLLAGCGLRGQAEPTPRPIATATPFSTPIAYPPTPVPVGNEDNPLTWVMVPANAEQAAAERAALESAMSQALGLTVQVELMETPGEVIERLCGQADGAGVMAMVDTLGFAITSERGCGVPAMRLAQEDTAADDVVIVSRSVERIERAAEQNLPFCRLNVSDVESWLLPLLLLRTRDLPDDAYGETLDRRTHRDSLRTVMAGGCWGAAVPERVLAAERAAGRAEGLRVLDRTAALPLGVLMVPDELPSDLGERMTAWLAGTPQAEATPEATPDEAATAQEPLLGPFIGALTLEPVEPDDLDGALRWFAQARINLGQLGG